MSTKLPASGPAYQSDRSQGAGSTVHTVASQWAYKSSRLPPCTTLPNWSPHWGILHQGGVHCCQAWTCCCTTIDDPWAGQLLAVIVVVTTLAGPF